jgi:anti-sigma factor ChrR (cupin superfamily)
MPIDLTQRGGEDMTRMTTAVLALGSLVWLSAAAMAQQAPMTGDCDKWIARINSEAGVRVDEAGWNARQNVDEIYKLCKDGKMAEAQKIATDTMTMLGITL